MKWYSIKKYEPSSDGFYITRFLDTHEDVGYEGMIYRGSEWLINIDSDSVRITHFLVPDPVEF